MTIENLCERIPSLPAISLMVLEPKDREVVEGHEIGIHYITLHDVF